MRLDFTPVDQRLALGGYEEWGCRLTAAGDPIRLPAEVVAARLSPIIVQRDLPPRTIGERTVRTWRLTGLDPWQADRVATALALHPHDIWGLEWSFAVDAAIENLTPRQRRRLLVSA